MAARLWTMLLLCACGVWAGKPFLHPVFQDHMVLQREADCPVWGWTAPGKEVAVTLADTTVKATAGADGKWLATLPPRTAGGPHELTVAGPQTVVLKDVLVGDVWVCSGQSNMDFGILGVDQWWNELGDYPNLRLCWVRPTSAFTPADRAPITWAPCNSGTLQRLKHPYTSVAFSAIAYMFGRKILQETGIPVGVVEAAQGNTSIDPWSTLASIRSMKRYAPDTDPFALYETKVEERWRESDPAWETTLAWRQPDFDDSAWDTVELPDKPGGRTVQNLGGVAWYRRAVEVPADWAGQALVLNLDVIDQQTSVWFNGRFVGGEDYRRRPNLFAVPADLVRAGRNVIVVRVFGQDGFMGAPATMTLSRADDAGEPVSLAGPWRVHPGTPQAELKDWRRQHDRVWVPSSLYNGMIHPLAPMAMRGFLWYQGEGNVGYSRTYEPELRTLIRDWRALFGQGDLPFYIVQLAGFWPLPATPPAGSGWANVRAAQAAVAASEPNCGLAVAFDRGELHNIHPPNKRDVANRLAFVALARLYGKDIPCEGPTYRAMAVDNDRVRITFDHAEGLASLGAAPAGFAIAGADRNWVWALARIDGDNVVVWSPDVPEPIAVRYAWADNATANLYNAANLPAVPFRTDDW